MIEDAQFCPGVSKYNHKMNVEAKMIVSLMLHDIIFNKKFWPI